MTISIDGGTGFALAPCAFSNRGGHASVVAGPEKMAGAAAGQFLILVVACHNHSGDDGDEGAVTSVQDSKGNTWLRSGEHCNGQGGAKAGATISVWHSVLDHALINQTDFITVNFSNAASRDRVVVTAVRFLTDLPIAVAGVVGKSDDGGDPSPLGLSLDVAEYLRIRAIAARSDDERQLASTHPGWFNIVADGAQTTQGASRDNISLRAEWRIATEADAQSSPRLQEPAISASVYIAFREA